MAGKPQEGFLKFNVEFDSLQQAAEFTNQTTTLQEMKIEIQNFIDKIVKSSRVTDREGLCIIQGKLAWSVSVSLSLLNDDGNVFDAFFLAAILALKNTRLPEVSISKNNIKINPEKVKYLNVHHLPVCTTFYFIRDSKTKTMGGLVDNVDEVLEPIIDVNSQEEKLCSARLSIVLNTYGDLCGMTTLGALEIGGQQDADEGQLSGDDEPQGAGLSLAQGYDAQELLTYMATAEQNTIKITKLLRQTWDNRNKEFGLLDEDLISNSKSKKKKVAQTISHQDYITKINEQMEYNRKFHPSREDEIEMNREHNDAEYDSKLIDLIQDSHDRKVADQAAGIRGPDDAGSEDQGRSNKERQGNGRAAERRDDQQMEEQRERARQDARIVTQTRQRREKLKAIEEEDSNEHLSLRSALK
jgi:exosome complex RNA-binding protein Rrp42 (RNase PH superfamily)